MLLKRFFVRLLARSSTGLRSSLKLILVLAVLLTLPALAYWRGLGGEQNQVSGDASEMVVEKLDQSANKINLVLKEKSGQRRLVVAVGVAEASSIVSDLNLPYNVPSVTAYSMTRSITEQLGGKVERVVVNDASDKALFAKIVVAAENREVAVDAAPSDAIALAVRTKAPIFVDTTVLDKAGIVSGR
jgi:bifunctional DNase/RNase